MVSHLKTGAQTLKFITADAAPGEVAAARLAEDSLQCAEETGSAAVGERRARRRSSRAERCGVSDDELDCPGAALSAEVPLVGHLKIGAQALKFIIADGLTPQNRCPDPEISNCSWSHTSK